MIPVISLPVSQTTLWQAGPQTTWLCLLLLASLLNPRLSQASAPPNLAVQPLLLTTSPIPTAQLKFSRHQADSQPARLMRVASPSISATAPKTLVPTVALDTRIRTLTYQPHQVVTLATRIGVVVHLLLEAGETYLTHALGDAEA